MPSLYGTWVIVIEPGMVLLPARSDLSVKCIYNCQIPPPLKNLGQAGTAKCDEEGWHCH